MCRRSNQLVPSEICFKKPPLDHRIGKNRKEPYARERDQGEFGGREIVFYPLGHRVHEN